MNEDLGQPRHCWHPSGLYIYGVSSCIPLPSFTIVPFSLCKESVCSAITLILCQLVADIWGEMHLCMGSKVARNGCQITGAYKCGCELHVHYACVLLWERQTIMYLIYVWCSNCLYIAYVSYHNMLCLFVIQSWLPVPYTLVLCTTICPTLIPPVKPNPPLLSLMYDTYYNPQAFTCTYVHTIWCCINIGYTILLSSVGT